jgi:hypothetical protein
MFPIVQVLQDLLYTTVPDDAKDLRPFPFSTASRVYHLLQSQNYWPSLAPLQTREKACTHPRLLLLAM